MQQDNSNDESVDRDIAALADEALQHYQEGHLQQAQTVCHRILRLRERPDAILILAKIAHEQEEFKVAAERYEQFLGIVPDHAQTHYYLGVVLEQQGRISTAIEHFRRSISIVADDAQLHRRLGVSLLRLGQAKQAIECFEQALRLRPDYIGARLDLARALRQLGRAEQALDQLKQVIDLRPACGDAYYHISMISPGQELVPVIENILADPDLPDGDAVYLNFALGNLFDSGKSYNKAFGYFLKANTLQRETFTYDANENSQTVDRLISVYSNGFFESKCQFGSASQVPVFIVGMPRSGTTLVEQILSSHASVHGAGEVEAFQRVNRCIAQQLKTAGSAPECMSQIGRKMIADYSAQYLQELKLHSPNAERITDKLPGNFVRIGLIKTLLPDARIIHCQRNALDNCVSIFFHNFPALTCSFELTELARYFLDYQRLMSHWQSLFPGEIFTVNYEDLVVNQKKVSKQLVDYIGLDWDEKCMDFHNNERSVMSPSNMQVRQPMYKSSINRWKNYEKDLQPLINVLLPIGERV